MSRGAVLALLVTWLCTLVGASYSARQGDIDGFLRLIGDLPALPSLDGPGK